LSHSSSLSEEDLKKFESFNGSPEVKIEEARIKPGLIRRRRKVVRKPVEERSETEKSIVPEPPVVDKVEMPAVDEPPVKEEPVAVAEPIIELKEEPADDVVVQIEATLQEVGTEKIADSEIKKEPEIIAKDVSVTEQASPKKADKVKKSVVEKVSGDHAKILGRVELPKTPPTTQRQTRKGERPARQDKATRPARPTRPETATSKGRKRVDAAPVAPMNQPLPEKEGRNSKKRKKGHRGDSNAAMQDGRVSRRGRRVEVFEPGRLGRKKKRGGKQSKQNKHTEVTISKAIKRIIRISDSITVGELAKRMGVKANELIAELMRQGSMVTINHPLDYESATILAAEFNYEIENVAFDEETILEVEPTKETEDKAEDLEVRPPVVTIMGHVDHGKTSLLDAIREANVTEGEAGGITQHIGAYDVELNGRKITFLDTPGHEAFTAMRARGAGVTDIVILVVAADDGVMPQTKEAINHSKAASVPIIIAVNKIDKPNANPERVKQELTEFELVPEEWGGDTIFVEVSAKQHTNLDSLLEMILLQAEVLELQANPKKRARGSIIEARLDKGRGPIATVLVQDGTLNIGDAVVAGLHFGRVRSMIAANGSHVKEAGPSFPVEVTGLGGVPNAGDVFHAVENEKAAKEAEEAAIAAAAAAEAEAAENEVHAD
jgi:translation initiation factor IF-2